MARLKTSSRPAKDAKSKAGRAVLEARSIPIRRMAVVDALRAIYAAQTQTSTTTPPLVTLDDAGNMVSQQLTGAFNREAMFPPTSIGPDDRIQQDDTDSTWLGEQATLGCYVELKPAVYEDYGPHLLTLLSRQAIAEAVWKLGHAFDTLNTAHGRHHSLIGTKKNTASAWRTYSEYLERKRLSAVTSNARPPYAAAASRGSWPPTPSRLWTCALFLMNYITHVLLERRSMQNDRHPSLLEPLAP
ncbi:hypothetical protein B0I35DRAFT_478704 [Stachybotrys elegans]|uniref:Uncharacterized protein n=1 Tax=Stachybotrys elegans TaxID=80388 RepID=A0A8K0SVX1_9HYPO|nr:hypothetical protein B0I35DRAFT_478704 [Stachybotrys elegans]